MRYFSLFIRCLLLVCLIWSSTDLNAQKQKRRYKLSALEKLQLEERKRMESLQDSNSVNYDPNAVIQESLDRKNRELESRRNANLEIAEVNEKPINKDSISQSIESTIKKAKDIAEKKQYVEAINTLNNLYDNMYDNKSMIEEAFGPTGFSPDTLLLMTSKWNFESNDITTAHEDLEAYLTYYNGSTNRKMDKDVAIYTSWVYYKMQNFNDAIMQFTNVLNDYKLNDSLQFYCHFYRATSHYNLEAYSEAYTDFLKCASIYPKKFEPQFNLGRCLFKEKVTAEDLNRAIKHFDEALKLNPYHIPSLFLKGRSYERLKKYKEALKDFVKCTELDQTYADAFYKKAYILYKINRNKIKASICEDFYKAVRLGSGEALIFYQENCGKYGDIPESIRK